MPHSPFLENPSMTDSLREFKNLLGLKASLWWVLPYLNFTDSRIETAAASSLERARALTSEIVYVANRT